MRSEAIIPLPSYRRQTVIAVYRIATSCFSLPESDYARDRSDLIVPTFLQCDSRVLALHVGFTILPMSAAGRTGHDPRAALLGQRRSGKKRSGTGAFSMSAAQRV